MPRYSVYDMLRFINLYSCLLQRVPILFGCDSGPFERPEYIYFSRAELRPAF